MQIAAAIRAEPDGYALSLRTLMGRHAAGHAYLRAALAERAGRPLSAYGPSPQVAEALGDIARQIDPAARLAWFRSDDAASAARARVLYLGDAMLGPPARLRLRAGMTAYALCGVTHTTATTSAMDEIAGLLVAPVAPWDALICTSTAVLATVRQVLDAQADYLRWRLGPDLRLSAPQLPVIPLGVHCADFEFSERERAEARSQGGVGEDEVAALYLGRLVSHGKAHPLAMFQGLQAAAERTGRKVAAILCGWAPNPHIEDLYRRTAAEFAPSVRLVMLDGRIAAHRRCAWASADLFVSLSDGIQETFGLTPIEAKAAGLPVVVSDWNGYRDTVREGVDGFRIATWAPMPGMGRPIASAWEAGALDYDHLTWAAAASTAVDGLQLAERLSLLVGDAALRRRMGAAGRADARARFDWTQIYAEYQALWAELDRIRSSAAADDAAPRANPARPDPFMAFGHYPTHLIRPTALAAARADVDAAYVANLAAHDLFAEGIVDPATLNAAFATLAAGPRTVSAVAAALGATEAAAARALGVLAKMGAINLS
jgi:alpha-maltose-1-phosphate synthase